MLGKDSLTPNIAFGLVLRRQRREAGLTQEQLSLESGVQRNFISLIETGQNQPTISTVFKLAAALNVMASDLLAEVEIHCGLRI
jgi:transcriptional regulator with XRE-family HTH domain